MTGPKFDWKMFRYDVSLPGAIVALVIFSTLGALHFWQWFRTRRYIIVWVVVGTACEVGGYGARMWAHYSPTSWGAFILQGCLLLTGPLFFAATIYMMLGRTIRLAGGEEVSIIKPTWCTRIFVGADISTLVLQGLGGGIMGTMKLKLAIAGEKIIIAGLALQVATFVAFVVVATDFHIRMNKAQIQYGTSRNSSGAWRKMLWILYSVSSLILFRCIFRLVEYSMGNAGYLNAHEWTIYVFDAVPMSLVLILMLVLQPAKYVPRNTDHKRIGSEAEELTAVRTS